MIVFIGCVKTKRKQKCPAEYLYISQLFRYSLKYAKTLTSPDKIFILSAKYGVLRLNDIVYPYEQCLNAMNSKQCKEWSKMCFSQMQKMNINFNEQAIFLCGENYRKYLIQNFTNYSIPLKNLRFGKQLKFYKGKFNEENRK